MTVIAPVLLLDGITKSFGLTKANAEISLSLGQGEMLALLGENGAGKTTLMNILFGHYVADVGKVTVFGKILPPGQPRAAIRAGIGMVHQHFALAENLTVLENVIAGTESLLGATKNQQSALTRLRALSARFELAVDPLARVGQLSIGERQRVEILKALYRDAKILILDEPTAVLTRQEGKQLFATLRQMTMEGLSLIFISHKLEEVMRADRVLVLRGGRLVAEHRPNETSQAELAAQMVGKLVERVRRQPQAPGRSLLRAVDVEVRALHGQGLDAASFELHAGEVLGIIGVSGNGQAALGRLLAGLDKPKTGTFELFGEEIKKFAPRDFVEKGISRIPEDRNHDGAVGEMSVWENTVIERLREPAFCRFGLLRRKAASDFAHRIIERFDVRGGTARTQVRLLSGGNLQKLILGRSLIGSPAIIVAGQPTRGLDEGAVARVHAELLAARATGAGLLIISEDLEEVLSLADRIQALVKGRLSPPIAAADADAETIGLMMAGNWDQGR
jgi:ABC-type uncharacterized transport system ATPase subunit